MNRLNHRLNRHSGILALCAMVLALIAAVGDVASATGVFVTSRQIKNGTILSQDIHNNQVKAPDIKNGTVGSPDLENGGVTSPDIKNGQVDGEDLGLPEPEQMEETQPEPSLVPGTTFVKVDDVGSYQKEEPGSALEVTWTGSAAEGQEKVNHGPCVFQLRVDGQASNGQGGGGEVFVASNQGQSVAVSALFEGLAVGPHAIEIWARHTADQSAPTSCTVSPAAVGIKQTFVIAEQVG